MYIIIDRKSKKILHMCNSRPGEDKQPQELMPDFDPKTMEFGRAPEQYIAEKFVIENGVVRNIEDEAVQLAATTKESVAEARERRLRSFSALSLALRKNILPDYKLQNAALGIYDAEETATIRATVEAFRAEYHRLEKELEKARSLKTIEAVEAKFPTALVQGKR
jgi:hypothetical protein